MTGRRSADPGRRRSGGIAGLRAPTTGTTIALTSALSALVVAALAVALHLAVASGRIRADAAGALASELTVATRAVMALPEPQRSVARAIELVHVFDGHDLVQVVLLDPAGGVRDRSAPQRRQGPAPAWFVAAVAGPVEERRLDLPGIGTIVLRASVGRPADRLWRDVQVLAGLVVVAPAAAGGLAAVAAARLARAAQRTTAALERAGGGDLDTRLDVPAAPAEATALAAAFNRMALRLRDTRDRDARIAVRRLAAEDEERRALARDLHDEIGPLLFAVEVDAGSLKALAGEPGMADEIAARAAAIETAVGAVKRDVRAILGQLRPGTAMKIGLRQALCDIVAFFADRHPAVAFDVAAPVDGWGGTVDGAIVAITREAVANALRHGRPTRIAVEVELRDGLIRLKVADDGGGLARERAEGGYGIVGMRERAAALGGRLMVDNRLDLAGVVVSASFTPPA